MTRADDTIVKFLLNDGNEPLIATSTFVEANIDYKISHIRSRMRTLHEAGLVECYDEDRELQHVRGGAPDLKERTPYGVSEVG